MKLFLDSADITIIKEWLPTGIIDGITTNPTYLGKQGNNVRTIIHELCKLVPGNVSIEVVEKKPELVYQQARDISSIASNAVVKIPFMKEYLPVIKKLVEEKITLNITLIFTPLQALLVAKLGVTYISPFVGRWDELNINGTSILSDIKEIMDAYAFESYILAASLRTLQQWQDAALMGADVATIPPSLLNPLMNHPLTLKGIAQFDEDWKKSGNTTLI